MFRLKKWLVLLQQKKSRILQFVKDVNYKSLLNPKSLSLTILLLALPITIIAAKTQQDLRENAAPAIQTKNVPYITISYLPLDSQNPAYLDTNETTIDHTYTVGRWRQLIDSMQSDVANFLTDGSRYHGYNPQEAIKSFPYLNYQRAFNLTLYEKVPPGALRPKTIDDGADPQSTAHNPNYYAILTDKRLLPRSDIIQKDNSICYWVNTQGVREVWIFAYHDSHIVPMESKMSWSHGDISNDGNQEGNSSYPSQYKMPICNHSYTVYTYSLTSALYGNSYSIGNMVHDHMHQIEALVGYMDVGSANSIWADNDLPDGMSGRFFSHGISYSGCGWTHAPPNEQVGAYHYASANIIRSDCEHWNPNDLDTVNKSYSTQGEKDAAINKLFPQINCTKWHCSDVGFYKWWMQNVPGYNNGIVYQGKAIRNWWELVSDLDATTNNGTVKTLLTAQKISSSTPTSMPSPAPKPIPPAPPNACTEDGGKNDGRCVNIEDPRNKNKSCPSFNGQSYTESTAKGVNGEDSPDGACEKKLPGTVCCVPGKSSGFSSYLNQIPTPTPTPAWYVNGKDPCASAQCGDGGYCYNAGASKAAGGPGCNGFVGQDGYLYMCKNGQTVQASTCSNGCSVNPKGSDYCTPKPVKGNY